MDKEMFEKDQTIQELRETIEVWENLNMHLFFKQIYRTKNYSISQDFRAQNKKAWAVGQA